MRRRWPGMEFCKGTEVQQRGALHLHAIVWSPEGLDVAEVQRMALAAGFGCSVDWAPADPGSRRAAYYVAKYVTKDAEPGHVPWDEEVLDTRTGELVQVTRAHFRPWTASRGWGVTMRELRAVAARAHAAAVAARRLEDLSTAAAAGDGNTERWLSGGGALPPPDR